MLQVKEKLINSIILLFISCFVLWYAFDTHKASNNIENTILIIPVAIITICLCVYEFFTQKITFIDDKKNDLLSIIPIVSIFTFYVLTLEFLGFDFGTIIFIGLCLYFYGEKRIFLILGYSIVFGFVIAYFFSNMLPYPMPMIFLKTDY